MGIVRGDRPATVRNHAGTSAPRDGSSKWQPRQHGDEAQRAAWVEEEGKALRRDQVAELHYITSVSNAGSIATHGILSHVRASQLPHRSIASQAVQDIRQRKSVPGGRRLHEYANLYFDARNPMMYKRHSHRRELIVVRVSPDVLDTPGAVIADGNAASGPTRFFASPAGLAHLDNGAVFAEYWTDNDWFEYIEKKRMRCAEVLVPEMVPCEALIGCYCSSASELGDNDVPGSWNVEVRDYVFFG